MPTTLSDEIIDFDDGSVVVNGVCLDRTQPLAKRVEAFLPIGDLFYNDYGRRIARLRFTVLHKDELYHLCHLTTGIFPHARNVMAIAELQRRYDQEEGCSLLLDEIRRMIG